MNNKILLLASGFMGSCVLSRLKEVRCSPFVAIYEENAVRRKDENLLKYSDFFQIWQLSSNKFDEVDNLDFSQFDYIVTIDWTKDFFHNHQTQISSKIYHAHPSLLPLYRGYGAVSQQFIRGVCLSGVSVYEENGVVDGGDIIFQEKIQIAHEDTPSTFLTNCADVVCDFIKKLEKGASFASTPQNPRFAFYLPRIRNNQKIIDFNASAYSVYNFIRAYYHPYPLASFFYKDMKYDVSKAAVESWSGVDGDVGEVLKVDDNGAEIACGDGSILIQEIYSSGVKINIDNLNVTKGERVN